MPQHPRGPHRRVADRRDLALGPARARRARRYRPRHHGGRPRRAGGARRLRGRRARRPDHPEPRRARPAALDRQGEGRGAPPAAARHARRTGDLRSGALARAPALAGGAPGRQGARPHRPDPGHLRAARPHARGQGAGRARAAELPPAPAPRLGRGDEPARRRHRHARARARRRWSPTASTSAAGSRSSVATSRRCRRRATRSAPAASARTCRRWRSPATRTPGSPRCCAG